MTLNDALTLTQHLSKCWVQ